MERAYEFQCVQHGAVAGAGFRIIGQAADGEGPVGAQQTRAFSPSLANRYHAGCNDRQDHDADDQHSSEFRFHSDIVRLRYPGIAGKEYDYSIP